VVKRGCFHHWDSEYTIKARSFDRICGKEQAFLFMEDFTMATENKSLKYFMRPVQQEIITFTGPESFKDDDGNPINFEAKILTQQEITQINENYRRRSVATDKKGNPLVNGGEVVWKTERNNARALRHIVVKSLQYPKLDDPELMKFYNCVDITDMPLLVFSKPGDYDYVTRNVMQILGMIDAPDEDDLKAAKN
jgi:hypothetical protein